MGRRVATGPLESQVRVRRLQAGLSQQVLAEEAGLTRQAVSAIEGGKYVPNTVVALRLAHILRCRVEDLFELPGGGEEREVEVVTPAARSGVPRVPASRALAPVRAVVAYARGRWVAHPLTARRALQEGFACADAVLPSGGAPPAPAARGAGPGGVQPLVARLWLDAEHLARTAVLLGCDPGLGIVAGHVARLSRGRDGPRLSWLEEGSAASLAAVASGTAHLAGIHLRDGETGEFNVPQAGRALAATGGVVVAFARWEQGLVVAAGNPKAVRTAADLARDDVRLVNREPGAGSRALLDQMLVGAGVPPTAVRGYDRIVAGHFEVACTVASGGADAGIALAAAAEAYGLDFVPLAEARFDVAVPADHLDHPAVALFLEALQTRALREELRLLPGYDVDELGTVRAEVPAAA
jgi:molybdate-binding protein/DNA-binding XRE family transcriptional regulator